MRLAGTILEELMQEHGIADLDELVKRVTEVDPAISEEDIRAFANSRHPFAPEELDEEMYEEGFIDLPFDERRVM